MTRIPVVLQMLDANRNEMLHERDSGIDVPMMMPPKHQMAGSTGNAVAFGDGVCWVICLGTSQLTRDTNNAYSDAGTNRKEMRATMPPNQPRSMARNAGRQILWKNCGG